MTALGLDDRDLAFGFTANFFVRGTPKAQPRAKATMRGKHASVYDPGTAEGWKNCVVRDARPYRPDEPIEQPVSLSLVFLMPRPKRLMRKRDPRGVLPHASKPDRDNLEKAVLDALTQDGWFRDDCQVCGGSVEKLYHDKAGVPGCYIMVKVIEGMVAA